MKTEEDELFINLNDDFELYGIDEEPSSKKSPTRASHHITWNSALDRPLQLFDDKDDDFLNSVKQEAMIFDQKWNT